jgi:hypothetical protein
MCGEYDKEVLLADIENYTETVNCIIIIPLCNLELL